MDRARKKTDKALSKMEQDINRLYDESPALKRIKKKYDDYMRKVENLTEAAYMDFINAEDVSHNKELKSVYIGQIEALTTKNKEYNDIIEEFTDIMADINQKSIDIVNKEMEKIYMINYNQVAVDCKKAGVDVNGKTDEME